MNLTMVTKDIPSWMFPYIEFFFSYTNGFIQKDNEGESTYLLKQKHTLNVLQNACFIAASETDLQDTTVCRGLLLGALFHDIARFFQFEQYRTFSDAHSFNHGRVGVKILVEQCFLINEPQPVKWLAQTVVGFHNGYRIPEWLKGEKKKVLLAGRDADKLDILRILADNLGLGCEPDSTVVMHLDATPGCYSSEIIFALKKNIVPSFTMMRYLNDFRLLACTWVTDLYFRSSKKKALSDGYFDRIVEGIDASTEVVDLAHSIVKAGLQD